MMSCCTPRRCALSSRAIAINRADCRKLREERPWGPGSRAGSRRHAVEGAEGPGPGAGSGRHAGRGTEGPRPGACCGRHAEREEARRSSRRSEELHPQGEDKSRRLYRALGRCAVQEPPPSSPTAINTVGNPPVRLSPKPAQDDRAWCCLMVGHGNMRPTSAGETRDLRSHFTDKCDRLAENKGKPNSFLCLNWY